jgi:uncharacterized protein YjbI with pentapeptide repeats
MRKIVPAILLIAGGMSLAACGSPTSHTNAYVPSKNCKISTSNLDLAGCNFENAKLQNVDLQGDDLQRANLANANLDGADIQGANVMGVVTLGLHTNDATVCTNGYNGPCTIAGLKGQTSGEPTGS